MMTIPAARRAVKVFITDAEGRFLTLWRTETAPHHPLTWDLPGGIVDSGESLTEGAIREVWEETGLTIADLEVTGSCIVGTITCPLQMTFYRAAMPDTEVTLSYEHSAYRWVTAEDFAILNAPACYQDATRHLIASI